ncbi:MAG: hypothetical protein HY815_20065 [Candidatus Riflebacteria bacterium]|nr:hypothetical protein [Candidatus Riflebacteria bacterium]
MVRPIAIVLLLLAPALASAAAPPPATVGGSTRSRCVLAMAPVRMTLDRLDPAAPGSEFRLRLTAVAETAVEAISLTLEVPAGARLTGGATRWQGPLASGGQQTLEARFVVPDNRFYRFVGVAEVKDGGSALVRQAQTTVGVPPRLTTQFLPPVVSDGRGTKLMVLPARVVRP